MAHFSDIRVMAVLMYGEPVSSKQALLCRPLAGAIFDENARRTSDILTRFKQHIISEPLQEISFFSILNALNS